MWFWPWSKKQAQLDTFRDWLSEDEWQEAIRQVSRRPLDFNGPERRAPEAPRFQAIHRCLLRVERRGQVLGVLLVRTRNLSSTGACVIHGGRIPRRAKATVVIQSSDGNGLITTGRVVWCKRVPAQKPAAHEIGIQFDEPVDVSGFAQPGSAITHAA